MKALKKLNRLQRGILIATGCILLLTFGVLAADQMLARPPDKMKFDTMQFDSLQHITGTSEAVIIGRVLKTEGPVAIDIMVDTELGSFVLDYMINEIEVLEVASGKLEPGDIITVKQRVGEDATYFLTEGDTSVLFLYDFRDLTDIAPFEPVNQAQSVINRGDVTSKVNRRVSTADVQKTLGVEGLGFDEIWKQVVEIASDKE